MTSIGWICPIPLEGSGGHRTIFQNVDALAAAGHECHIYFKSPTHTSQSLATFINSHFGGVSAHIHCNEPVSPNCDLYFATLWETAKDVHQLATKGKKAYFVQDYEAYFHPMGDGFLLAEQSYRYPLKPITIGRWLTHKLHADFGNAAQFFDFCADKSTYKCFPGRSPKQAVCFIYQPEKPRRCPHLGIEALGILKALKPDVEIYLYGTKETPHLWFNHHFVGLLRPDEINGMYNMCSAGLCISSSNPSRIPFEMMAAGLPVVDIYRENNFYDYPSDAILLTDATPYSLAAGLFQLLENEPLRLSQKEAGLRFMKDRDLRSGFDQFVSATESLLSSNPRVFYPPVRRYSRACVYGDEEGIHTRIQTQRNGNVVSAGPDRQLLSPTTKVGNDGTALAKLMNQFRKSILTHRSAQ